MTDQKIEKLDPELRKMFIDLMKSADGEIKSVSKTLKQEKTRLEKALAKQKKTKDRRVELVKKHKTKPTKTVERQLEKAKEDYDVAATSAKAQREEVTELRNVLRELKARLSKYEAMTRQLVKFEKDWSQKSEKKTKIKPTKAASGKKRGRKSKKADSAAEMPQHFAQEAAEMAAEI